MSSTKQVFNRSRSAQHDLNIFSKGALTARMESARHSRAGKDLETDTLAASVDLMFTAGDCQDTVQDYLQDIDQLVNNKITLGMKNMMKVVVKKIVTLIDTQVASKVVTELEVNMTDVKTKLMTDIKGQLDGFGQRLDQMEKQLTESQKVKQCTQQKNEQPLPYSSRTTTAHNGLAFNDTVDSTIQSIAGHSTQNVQIFRQSDRQNFATERQPLATERANERQERQTLANRGPQTCAQRRKSRAENLSPVDEDLGRKINALKNAAEELKYMNKAKPSVQLNLTVRKPSHLKSLVSAQLQQTLGMNQLHAASSQASLNSKPSQKSFQRTMKPVAVAHKGMNLKKLLDGGDLSQELPIVQPESSGASTGSGSHPSGGGNSGCGLQQVQQCQLKYANRRVTEQDHRDLVRSDLDLSRQEISRQAVQTPQHQKHSKVPVLSDALRTNRRHDRHKKNEPSRRVKSRLKQPTALSLRDVSTERHFAIAQQVDSPYRQ